MTITARYPSTCSRCGGGIAAGQQIEWDRDTKTAAHTGSCPENPAPAPERGNGGQLQVPAPAADTRAGRMLLAGELAVTMTVAGGEHATFYLRCLLTPDRSAKNEWERCAWDTPDRIVLVSAAKRGQRIGRITGTSMSFRDDVHADTRAAFAVLMTALGDPSTPEVLPSEDASENATLHGLRVGDVLIQPANTCGACGRELKRPESIDLGLGPECSGKGSSQYTGKGHVTVKTDAPAQSFDPVAAAPVDVTDTRAPAATTRAGLHAQGLAEGRRSDGTAVYVPLEAHTPDRPQGAPTPTAPTGALLTRVQVGEHNAVLAYIARADADTLAHLATRIATRRQVLRGE